MKLKEYFDRFSVNIEQFSKKIDVSRRTIYDILKEKSTPNLTTAAKIMRETQNLVTYEDLLLEDKPKKIKKIKKVDSEKETK